MQTDMQDRYTDRRLYFNELAQTSREYLIGYIGRFRELANTGRVLEIGCGEGGNLLPFADMGSDVCGIDISKGKIDAAARFFAEDGRNGSFICSDFLAMDLTEHIGRYDVIILHDVIEHIASESKAGFMSRLGSLLKRDGIIMAAFPAWAMPFGGHQQICRKRLCRIPFIHLLPVNIYRGYLHLCGEPECTVEELLSIRRAGTSIESFEAICQSTGLAILDRTLWLINPHYKVKFSLRPRLLPQSLSTSRWLRNHLSSSCFYILSPEGSGNIEARTGGHNSK